MAHATPFVDVALSRQCHLARFSFCPTPTSQPTKRVDADGGWREWAGSTVFFGMVAATTLAVACGATRTVQYLWEKGSGGRDEAEKRAGPTPLRAVPTADAITTGGATEEEVVACMSADLGEMARSVRPMVRPVARDAVAQCRPTGRGGFATMVNKPHAESGGLACPDLFAERAWTAELERLKPKEGDWRADVRVQQWMVAEETWVAAVANALRKCSRPVVA